jgi:hypothetical protein
MQQDEVHQLKQAWLASGLFADEQAYLAARVRLSHARFVYLDPVETWGEWLMVVIRHPTGIIYGTQCAGVGTEQRFIEGYLVPLAGTNVAPARGDIQSAPLRAIFHQGNGCIWSWTGQQLPTDRRERLAGLVKEIPYWHHPSFDVDIRSHMQLDQERMSEIAEAWIPIQTVDGPGVLLYDNCD